MGILADIYVSHDSDAVTYDTSPKTFEDRVEYKHVSPLELSTLWALMRGVKWDVSLMKEFECVLVVDGGERVIHRVPSTFTADLKKLDQEKITILAAKWAATDEWSCSPENVRPIIEDLVRLAGIADGTGRAVFVWNCV